jgi:cytochrome c553
MRDVKVWVFSFYLLLAVIMLALGGFGLASFAPPAQAQSTPMGNCPSWPLPLPSKVGPVAFEAKLGQYVNNNCYQQDSKWKYDAQYRDTGFFIANKKLGTHNSVRVYYSPEMYEWMKKGEPEGKIPDGAAIIKEMYPMPASQSYTNNDRTGWAIMVRDSKASWDGWFWSDGGNTISYTYQYPSSGYALYCMNCHASTAKTDLTFSAMRNILGDPLVFNPTLPSKQITVGSSLRRGADALRAQQTAEGRESQQAQRKSSPSVHEKRDSRQGADEPQPKSTPRTKPSGNDDAEAIALNSIPKQMVMEYFDNVTQGPRPKPRDSFLTSNQCIGCHDATQNNDSQPNMIYPQIYTTPPGQNTTELDLNLSPYSEWRASIMGLSGRDPIFYSQLETELALHPEQKDNIVGTCLSCHGVMGQRQIEQDKKGPFMLEYLDLFDSGESATPPPYARYGALARDGVSCTVCHRISNEGLGTPATYTGKFKLGKPDEIFGPYEDVVKLPMENAIGLTPQKTKENQIRKSALCGSCHTVVLPVLNIGEKYSGNVFDNPKIKSEHEQNTYLEWRNSKYQNEKPPIDQKSVKTCQDCHMPSKYPSNNGTQLQFKIASIEEDIFAATDNRAADNDIHLQVRGSNADEPYSRHTLLGMNIFALEIFNQFSDKLGLVSYDPMTAFWNNPPSAGMPPYTPGLVLAKKSALDLARNETAQVELLSVTKNTQKLTAQVKVTNLAGHKFPSGVSFRRAFIEFRVDVGGVTRWASGMTDNTGMIGTYSGGKFMPLVSESFNLRKNPQQIYQPHYEIIDDEKEVQIYEELIKDSNGNFTTSFLSLANPVKDNRLMPQGWKCIEQEDGKNDDEPCGGTAPHGVPDNPRLHPNSAGYFNGTGSDVVTYEVPLRALGIRPGQPISVTATVYYQTIPPYYLEQRRDHAPNGVFTRSLMYYVRNLDVNKIDKNWELLLPEAPIKDWKLMIASQSRRLK